MITKRVKNRFDIELVWKRQCLGGFPIQQKESNFSSRDFNSINSNISSSLNGSIKFKRKLNIAVVVQRLERTVVVRKTRVRFSPSALKFLK